MQLFNKLFFRVYLLLTFVVFSVEPILAAGKIQLPAIGDRIVWECDGPWGQIYDIKVIKIKKNVVVYQGFVDDNEYQVEKQIDYLGTTLWNVLAGIKQQQVDPYYFSGISNLKPGSVFKGPVPISIMDDKWVWEYVVKIGNERVESILNLGKVRVVPLEETRRVFHSPYWSKMKSEIAPDLGITIRWTFTEDAGEETCELKQYTPAK